MSALYSYYNNISNIDNSIKLLDYKALTEPNTTKRFYLKCEMGNTFWVCGCNLRTCEDCMRKRKKKIFKALMSKFGLSEVTESKSYTHLILTLKNVENFTNAYYEEKRKQPKKLLRWLQQTLKIKILIGYYGFENVYHEVGDIRYDKRTGRPIGIYKKDDAGHHFHIHILFYGDRIQDDDMPYIQSKWLDLTKDSFITRKIDVFENPKIALSYVLKYIGKVYSQKRGDLQFLEVVKKKRLYNTFGHFYGKLKVPKPLNLERLCACSFGTPHKFLKTKYNTYYFSEKDIVNKNTAQKYDFVKNWLYNLINGRIRYEEALTQEMLENDESNYSRITNQLAFLKKHGSEAFINEYSETILLKLSFEGYIYSSGKGEYKILE